MHCTWKSVKDSTNVEAARLVEDTKREKNWKRWGPYLSERQWGTCREDYSPNGDSWNFVSHDKSRSYAYRWGEDGIMGICDRQGRMCFSLAMWNEKDPILKERLFGLTGPEGNHGEDVKEQYFYLNSLPTHSYMKGLYKYPQNQYPYDDLVRTNRDRTRHELEYEILDTGVFNDRKYWDVYVEYAKDSPNNILIKITIKNNHKDEANIHFLPTLLHRNTWAFNSQYEDSNSVRRIFVDPDNPSVLRTVSPSLGEYFFSCESFVELDKRAPEYEDTDVRNYLIDKPEWIFTENDTNNERLYNSPNRTPYVKDAFHEYVIHKNNKAINPNKEGSKVAAYHKIKVPGNSSVVIKLRFYDSTEKCGEDFGIPFSHTFKERKTEHDKYYDKIIPEDLHEQEKEVCIQAFAGLLWSKQLFFYVIKDWLEGDRGMPPPPETRKEGRNSDWLHLFNRDIISMPDKWEYPWYAVWDLAFHMVSMALIDIDFAKDQLLMFLREWYMHPNGCLPAYEYNFGDVNPPVHAWACWKVYRLTGTEDGKRDTDFLARVFQKLIINFTWWVNRKDPEGNNLFSGGFLGLDNIGVFDRSQPLPTGGYLQQADGTSWMAFYCLYMLKIAMELATYVDSVYEDLASKFFEHFVLIADAMNAMTEGKQGLWDKEDGFYYDQIIGAKGDEECIPLKVRSLVGLTPLFASGVIPLWQMEKLPGFHKRTKWFLEHRKDLAKQIDLLKLKLNCHGEDKDSALFLLSIPLKDRIASMFEYLYDETEFLSDYGIRSLSKHHEKTVYVYECVDGNQTKVKYLPGESDTYMFGGNSNWRGPVWLPMNYLILESLERLDHFYGEELALEYPKGSGEKQNPCVASMEISERLASLFLPNNEGKRPCHGNDEIFSTDWKDLIYYYEHFHPETGRGIGASHQTGWTSLVTNLLFKVGRDRQIKKKNMDEETRKLYDEHSSAFNKQYWEKVGTSPSIFLNLAVEKGKFRSIADLLETLYKNAPWKYQSLVLRHFAADSKHPMK